MLPWIVQLGEVALERNPGVAAPSWAQGELPEELAALYREMNGALLPGEVRLVESSALQPGAGGLHFGHKGDQRLLAVRRGDVYGLAEGGVVPAWVEALEPDAWLFAVAGEPGALRLYRTLERMLEVIVPPQVKEEFGEHTFVRALNAVQDALGALRPVAATPELKVAPPVKVVPERMPHPKAPRAAAKPAASKASKSKVTSKRAPAATKAAAKSGPAKKGAAKKPRAIAKGPAVRKAAAAKTAKPAPGRKAGAAGKAKPATRTRAAGSSARGGKTSPRRRR